MTNELSFAGLFWLPDKEEDKISGTLTFNKEKGTTLELLGSLTDFITSNEHFQPDIINGFSSSGKKLTLYKCFELGRSFSSPGMNTSKMKCRYLFVGALRSEERRVG